MVHILKPVKFFKKHLLSWVINDGLGVKITSNFEVMLTLTYDSNFQINVIG